MSLAMLGNWIWMAVLCGFLLSGLAIVLGVWLPRRKGLPEWVMAIGGTVFSFGLLASIAAWVIPYFGVRLGGAAYGIVIYTSVSGGLLVFAMGFLADRLRQRAIDRHLEEGREPGAGRGCP